MKIVAIPFKDEDVTTVLANLEIAASHPSIDAVWGVGSNPEIATRAVSIEQNQRTQVEIFGERRIGHFRQGKGDAMNTALLRAHELGVTRLHFYDADITNFSAGWIDGAESAADRGYQVVRHSFPRAATDAMITWFVTKPMFAIKYPDTVLPEIGQPLGGECLVTKNVIDSLAGSPGVLARSDWGIDTMLTFTTVQQGFSLYEHHVSDGKRHALYGSLNELKQMLVECFDAVSSLGSTKIPTIDHSAEKPARVPADLRREIGYDRAATLPHLTAPYVPGERDLIDSLPEPLVVLAVQLAEKGDHRWLDAERWESVLLAFHGRFQLGDPAWESLLFRLWAGRVLNYTRTEVIAGYESALQYLAVTIARYQENARSRPV